MKERLATLISGSGTTMQEIIRACQSGEIPMDIACVISSTISAAGIDKARGLGISEKDIIVVDPRADDFGQKVLKELKDRGVTVVTQNGWLPLTPEIVIDEYPGMIFNQHPGSVPEFGGKYMYGRRIHAAKLLFTRMVKRDYWTEATAQRVGINFDEGEVVKSERIEILPSDAVDDLQQRVLPVEHRLQKELLLDIARGNVREVPKRERLVRPDEEQILLDVKKVARLLYPHG